MSSVSPTPLHTVQVPVSTHNQSQQPLPAVATTLATSQPPPPPGAAAAAATAAQVISRASLSHVPPPPHPPQVQPQVQVQAQGPPQPPTSQQQQQQHQIAQQIPPEEAPLYVNAKQFHRILKRRVARSRLEEQLRQTRKFPADAGVLDARDAEVAPASASASPSVQHQQLHHHHQQQQQQQLNGVEAPGAIPGVGGGGGGGGGSLTSLLARKPYLHESRHNHAMRRPRGPGGRFLTAEEVAEREKLAKEQSKEQSPQQHAENGGGVEKKEGNDDNDNNNNNNNNDDDDDGDGDNGGGDKNGEGEGQRDHAPATGKRKTTASSLLSAKMKKAKIENADNAEGKNDGDAETTLP